MNARKPLFAVALIALGWAGTAGAATQAQKCEADKLNASARKAACLLKAEAVSVKNGTAPRTTQCERRFG